MQDKVGGYTIIVKITVGKIVIALGEHLKSPSPYGTWLARTDSPYDYFWRHYFGDKISALTDFGKRITNEAELANREMPRNEQIQNKTHPNQQNCDKQTQKKLGQPREAVNTQSHHQRSKPEKER